MRCIAKIIVIFTLGILITFFYSGCMRESESSKSKETTTGNKAITLKYYVWGNDKELKAVQSIIDGFTSANPNIKVKIETVSGDYYQKLLAALSGGTGPDIFYMTPGCITPFIRSKLVLPLDYFLENNSKLTKEDLWSVNDNFRFDGSHFGKGKLYGLIKDWSPDFMLFYNKKHFREAGIPLPDEKVPITWERFKAIAEKLTKRDKDGKYVQYGTLFEFEPMYNLMQMIMMNGGSIYSKDNRTVKFSDPEVMDAIRFFISLQKGNKAPSQPFYETHEKQSGYLFAEQKVSTIFIGRWAIPAFFENATDLDYGVAPPPIPEGKSMLAVTSGMVGHCVSKNSKYPKEVLNLLEYISISGQEKVAELGWNIPGNRTMAKEFFSDSGSEKIKKINKQFLDMAESCTKPIPTNPYITIDRVKSILWDKLSYAMAGKVPLEEALKKAADTINEEIAKVNE